MFVEAFDVFVDAVDGDVEGGGDLVVGLAGEEEAGDFLAAVGAIVSRVGVGVAEFLVEFGAGVDLVGGVDFRDIGADGHGGEVEGGGDLGGGLALEEEGFDLGAGAPAALDWNASSEDVNRRDPTTAEARGA